MLFRSEVGGSKVYSVREPAAAASSGWGGVEEGKRQCVCVCVCVKTEESEQGMLEVRKTCGLGECGSGTGEGRGRYLGKEKLREEETLLPRLALVGWGAAQKKALWAWPILCAIFSPKDNL